MKDLEKEKENEAHNFFEQELFVSKIFTEVNPFSASNNRRPPLLSSTPTVDKDTRTPVMQLQRFL